MKIIPINQYFEKLKINQISINDLNNVENPKDVIHYYEKDFVSGDNSGWIEFTDFYYDIISKNGNKYGLVFKRYPEIGNSQSKLLHANYDSVSECLEFALSIWGIAIDRYFLDLLDPIMLKHLSGKFGFDYVHGKYDTNYIEKNVSDLFNHNNIPYPEKLCYLKFDPTTCFDNMLFELFHDTGDYTNEFFATGLSCTDDFVTFDNEHLKEFSLIVRLMPKKEITKSNKCMNDAIDCINHSYKALIKNFYKELNK